MNENEVRSDSDDWSEEEITELDEYVKLEAAAAEAYEKRPIKAHKGGRSERMEVRLTPEIKRFFDALPISAADWIEQKAREDLKKAQTEEQIMPLYEAGLSRRDIASRLGIDVRKVRKVLNEAGVSPRKQSAKWRVKNSFRRVYTRKK